MKALRQDQGVVRVYLATAGGAEPIQTRFSETLQEATALKARAHGIELRAAQASSWLGRLRPKKQAPAHADLVVAVLEPDTDVAVLAETIEQARRHDKELWLYWRTLDDDTLAREDTGLKPLLDFRDRIERDGQVPYHAYRDADMWQALLLRHLFAWLDHLPPDRASGALPPGDLDARLDTLADEAPSAEVRAALHEAWALAAAGRRTRAAGRFARLLDGGGVAARLEYARFLGDSGATERAEAHLGAVLDTAAPAVVERCGAALYRRLGSASEARGDFDAARRSYERARDLDVKTGADQALAVDYDRLGHLFWMQSALEDAEAAYREALALNKRLGRTDGQAAAFSNLGNVYGVWGRLDDAEAMYREALALTLEHGWREEAANQYGNLGILFRVQGRLEEAEAMYREALVLGEALGRREALAEAYSNLGNVYQERGDLAEAEAMYRKALALDEALGRPEGMAAQYGNLGVLFQARKAFDEAEAMFRKALAIYETLGDFITIEQVHAWISNLDAERRAS